MAFGLQNFSQRSAVGEFGAPVMIDKLQNIAGGQVTYARLVHIDPVQAAFEHALIENVAGVVVRKMRHGPAQMQACQCKRVVVEVGRVLHALGECTRPMGLDIRAARLLYGAPIDVADAAYIGPCLVEFGVVPLQNRFRLDFSSSEDIDIGLDEKVLHPAEQRTELRLDEDL